MIDHLPLQLGIHFCGGFACGAIFRGSPFSRCCSFLFRLEDVILELEAYMAEARWAWSAGTSSSMWFVSHQQRNEELFALPSVQIGSQSVDACPPLSVGFECHGKLFCKLWRWFFFWRAARLWQPAIGLPPSCMDWFLVLSLFRCVADIFQGKAVLARA